MICSHKPRFHTRMALLAHARTTHDCKLNIDQYVDASGVCPVCEKQFPTRIQVVRHLSQITSKSKTNKNKTMCRELLLNGCLDVVPHATLCKIREKDRVVIRAANKCGKAFPKVPLRPVKHHKRTEKLICDSSFAPLHVYEQMLPKKRRLSAKAPPPPSYALRENLKRSSDSMTKHVSQCFTKAARLS